ncbi:MAG TPA: TonB-dependent receptor [Steroidobacteraceae bacterium]
MQGGNSHRGTRLGFLVTAAALLITAQMPAAAAPIRQGESLSQALLELRQSGLALIFSSGLIDPSFKVNVDPGKGTAEEIAGRILAPYGLALQAVTPKLFAVVKRPPPPASAPAPGPEATIASTEKAAPEAPKAAEIDVYASRYGVADSQTVPHPSTDISRQDLETMPALFQDAMRAMRFMPGSATSAVSARPHVRGGREDEVATYFDGVPLFEPYHYKDVQALLGTLDPETISTLNFFSGVSPARYGNRMSGVLDMQPRTWDGQNYYALSQSLLYSEALAQGRASSTPLEWLGAVRVGVIDFVSDLLDRTQVDPHFMDALGRLQYDVGDRSQVAVGYLLLDDSVHAAFNSSSDMDIGPPLTSQEQAQINYRDDTGWLGWSFRPSDTSLLHATLSRTERHTERNGVLDRQGSAQSSLQDSRHFSTTTMRLEGTADLTERWHANTGVEWYDYDALYNFNSAALFDPRLAAAFHRPDTMAIRTNLRAGGQAYAAYGSVLWALDPIAIDVGVRWDGERYGVAFRANQISPRVSVQWQLDPLTILRASWGRLSQTQRPDELQVQDGDNVFHRAEFAMQSVLSLEHRLTNHVQLHVEAFDKRIADPRPRFENLLDPIALLPEIEVDRVKIQASSSRTYGAEFSFRWQASEHLSGWANYSWSQATDTIDSVVVPRSWDQKHAAAAGMAWRISPWLFSADVTWHSGWPRNRLHLVSVAPIVFEYAYLNDRTWRDYFSLDSRITWTHSLPQGAIELFGEIDNATNHANPCCTDVQFAGSTARPLLERTTSVWLPRFALVGATWKLP